MGHKNKREDREARRAADLPPHVYDIAKQDTTYIHQTRLPNIQKDCERAVEAKDTDWLNKMVQACFAVLLNNYNKQREILRMIEAKEVKIAKLEAGEYETAEERAAQIAEHCVARDKTRDRLGVCEKMAEILEVKRAVVEASLDELELTEVVEDQKGESRMTMVEERGEDLRSSALGGLG